MSVELLNIEKYFGESKVLHDISFKVEQGEIVGFLGPNGAGKSTTMKIICGYLHATKGQILIHNKPFDQSPIQAKKNIGYLSEHNPLYLDLYVREYLHFVGTVQGLTSKTAQERIDELSQQILLQEYLKSKIGALSKGYRQRVGLAAALIGDPSILILDEPTAGLDPNQSLAFRSIIRTLAKEKAILLSSHILSEVEAVCDRFILIHQGKLVGGDHIATLKKQQISMEDMFRKMTLTAE